MEAELIIIGGGASGTAVLQALAAATAAQASLRGWRVVLLERSDQTGPGLPYGPAADPLHTMGRTATLRHDKGQQLQHRFTSAVEHLLRAGVQLTVLTRAEARALERTPEGWTVTTNQGTWRSPRVVLATGHWHVHRLHHLRRAVDWRWDVRRLHAAIADHEDVIVLGMGQSGLDIAVSLAERRRTLPHAGRIHLVSRSGLLPSVFGYIGGTRRHQPTRALETLLAAREVRLDDVVEATRAGVHATLGDEALPFPWTLAALNAALSERDGVAHLRRDLTAAQASLAASRPLPWQPVLWHGLAAFHALLPRLCAEDRLTLAAHWTPVMRQVEAIHVDAAARILAAIDAGQVRLHAAGPAFHIEEDADGVWVRGSAGSELRAHRIIDARGPDPRVGASDDPFLHALLESKRVVPGRVKFRAAPSPAQALPEGWSVAANAHGDWLLTGGLWVDPTTFQIRDESGSPTDLYALGPLTVGQFPFYAGLWATRRAAKLMVASIFR